MKKTIPTPLKVEQFAKGIGKHIMENAVAIYLPVKHGEGYWITGSPERMCWSRGSKRGIRGKVRGMDESFFDDLVCSMHRGCVAYALNNGVALAIIPVGNNKYQTANISLYGFGKWESVLWYF